MRSKMRKLTLELQRKGFHISGLIIPVVYYTGMKYPLPGMEGPWLTREIAAGVVGLVAALSLAVDLARLSDRNANRWFIRMFGAVMRKSERRGVTGASYYLIGACASILLFPPAVAIAATLFLVFGDFAAALVGMAVGRIRLLGGKTLEGAAACFAVCAAVGLLIFWKMAPSWTYPALTLAGAGAATLAELLPGPFNDNLTIPLISGFAVVAVAFLAGLDVTNVTTDIPLP